MYIFFTVFGVVFVSFFATFLNYIYEIFPVNNITNFLFPVEEKGTWDKISVTVLPILIWSCVEIPLLGNSSLFIINIITNIVISCAVIYVIKYGSLLLFNKKSNIINLISIYVATIFGQAISFMLFNIGNLDNKYYLFSIIGVIVIIGFYVILKIRPPKTSFFRE